MIDSLLTALGFANRDEAATTLPFLLVLYAVLGLVYTLGLLSAGAVWDPVRLGFFTLLMAVHALLHALSPRLRKSAQLDRDWPRLAAYLAVQGLLLLGLSALAKSDGALIGLYLLLAAESAAIVWPNVRATASVLLASLGLLALNRLLSLDAGLLAGLLPAVALMAAFAFIVGLLFRSWRRARRRTKRLEGDLALSRQRQQVYAGLVQDLRLAQFQQRAVLDLQDELAGNLEDLVGQLAVARNSEDEPLLENDWLESARQQAQTALDTADRASQALRAQGQERGRLINALIEEVDHFTGRTGIPAALEVDDLTLDVPSETTQGILGIVQESLNNVARHAQASSVGIQVLTAGEALKIVVQDNGVGFAVAEGYDRPNCHGLRGMQERAHRIGGQLRVESIPGSGTRLLLTLPRLEPPGAIAAP